MWYGLSIVPSSSDSGVRHDQVRRAVWTAMLVWESPWDGADWRTAEVSSRGLPILDPVWLVVPVSVVWRLHVQRPVLQGPRVSAPGHLAEAMLDLRASHEGTQRPRGALIRRGWRQFALVVSGADVQAVFYLRRLYTSGRRAGAAASPSAVSLEGCAEVCSSSRAAAGSPRPDQAHGSTVS